MHDDDGDDQFCIDSSNAHYDDVMENDTPLRVLRRGELRDHRSRRGGDRGSAGGTGGLGAVPTRIDTGVGGAEKSGNPLLLGAVLTGATAALAAGAARRRRRS